MQTDAVLGQKIDDLVTETCKPTEPGVSVIAVKDGKTIFRKARGMANLELGVAIEPDMVFRIGSITKQFTAVAILMMVEEGKMSLEDPVTRFFPGYPTQGYVITIKHLLTHTSGLGNYTDHPQFWASSMKDFTVQEFVERFQNQPMHFAPGQCWRYSNSGYFLLGAIVEKVSGESYAQFVQKRIFDPLEMKTTYYDTPRCVIPRRVSGYDKTPQGFANCAYVSMTQPYAAGSLASTVDDLARWDAALYTERLLKRATILEAYAAQRLADGTDAGYGYGWRIVDYRGHLTVDHSGGINGFSAYAVRLPEDRAFVAALSNLSRSPELLALKIAGLMIGEPYEEPMPAGISAEALPSYQGVYKLTETAECKLTTEDGRLFHQLGQGLRSELLPLSTDEFFFKDVSIFRILFVRDASGAVVRAEIRGRSKIPQIWVKIK